MSDIKTITKELEEKGYEAVDIGAAAVDADDLVISDQEPEMPRFWGQNGRWESAEELDFNGDLTVSIFEADDEWKYKYVYSPGNYEWWEEICDGYSNAQFALEDVKDLLVSPQDADYYSDRAFEDAFYSILERNELDNYRSVTEDEEKARLIDWVKANYPERIN